MSDKLGYEIVESGTRGKIVIATRDFLAGETVIEETEPVLSLTEDVLAEFKKYDPSENHIYLAAFVVAMKRSDPAKKAKLLTLYGPTTGVVAERLRLYSASLHFSPNDDTDPREMTPEEAETFIKIGNVVRLNAFGGNDSKLVFSEITRLAHSCSANCNYHIRNKTITCRTLTKIAAGEELTISYLSDRDKEPTHLRRQKYLTAKEFTCHCPRCDAPGDDTRQFDCFDPACKGTMMVCQPVNKEKIYITNLPYTGAGVEYVEPHLLHCTVCNRASPVAYQTKMLALEARLPALVADIVHRQADMVSRDELGADRYDRLIKEIYDLKLPMRHQMVVPIHNVLVKSIRFQFMDVAMGFKKGDVEQRRAAVYKAANDYIAAQEGVTPGNNSNLSNVLYQVCSDIIIEWLDPRMPCPYMLTPAQAKPLLQRFVRMQLILSPRNLPRDAAVSEALHKVDTALLTILEKLPQVLSQEVCAFCVESPTNAFMKRTRCGACKKVVYCSAGCQRVHWKLHKKTCKTDGKP